MSRRIISGALIFLALLLAAWRYVTIPNPIRVHDGTTSELTLEASGFSCRAPYGKQVAVRLNGVSGTLYYSGNQDVAPGELITGAFRITLTPRSGSHFKATTYDDLIIGEGNTHLWDLPVVWSRAIKDRIASLYSGAGAQLLTGILTGDRSGFSDSLIENLFSTGITHVAAVSGLHVSMLAGFIALVTRSRRRSFIISLPLVFLYVAITGFTPSAVRAGIMLTVMTLAPLLGREYTPLRALVSAFLVLCVINPYAVFEPGLQLSFSATLGLLLFASRWNKAFAVRFAKHRIIPERVRRYLSASIATSLAALVFSLPFAAYWFDGASIISPLSNLLLLWLCNIIFIGGALSLAIPFLAPVVGTILSLFLSVIGLLGKIPYAVLYTTQPYLLAWMLYGYVLFVVAAMTRKWKAPALLAVSMLVVCLSLTVWRDGRFRLEIVALDVGQGQCVVVRSGGRTAVIDCGGNARAGQTAARYLQSRGVRQVDALLLTHYDSDHVNGVQSLLSTVNVANIQGPALDNTPSAYPVQSVTEEATFTLGKADITLIPSQWIGEDNERCMSVLVTLDGFSFLVTGDLGQAAERWLLRRTGLTEVDVMMAGHHGSKNSASDELLDVLAPQATLVSVGINKYGHPSTETLEKLFNREIAVYRTDRRGHVIVLA